MGNSRKADSKLAIGYVRVSTAEQKLGPIDQARSVEKWAEHEGLTLVAVYLDLGVSGAKAAHKRPGLTAALAGLNETRAGVLVAANRSRIGRSIAVVREIEQAASKLGAQVRTADGMSDGKGSGGRLSRGLVDLVHEWEREVISERTKAAFGVLRSQGRKLGQVPYGFRAVQTGTRVDKHGHLVPVSHLELDYREQDVIKAARALQQDGASTRKIAAQLEAWGYLSRVGKPFRQTQVVRMLKPQEGVS